MSDTMIRYRVGLAEQSTVTGVVDLVDGHVRRAARYTETEAEEMCAKLDALRVLVGRLLSKAALRGIVSADELIEWLDVPDAHDALLVASAAEAVHGAMPCEICDGTGRDFGETCCVCEGAGLSG